MEETSIHVARGEGESLSLRIGNVIIMDLDEEIGYELLNKLRQVLDPDDYGEYDDDD